MDQKKMRPQSLLTVLALSCAMATQAQKQIFSYPFEFEKSFLALSDYDAYFLDSRQDSSFSLILKDNKKVDYVLLNKQFKVASKVSGSLDNTVFTKSGLEYAGGTAAGTEYHFIYYRKKEFFLETVHFTSKTTTNKALFELDKGEKLLASYSDFNHYMTLAANDKTSELVVYTVDQNGTLNKKAIPFKVPEYASRKRNDLSEYLKDLKVVKGNEEPDIINAIKPAKLFSQQGRFDLVVNDGDNPTHIVTVTIPDLSTSEKFLEYGDLVAKEERGKLYTSTFLKGGTLFTLLLNKRNVRIAVHDLATSRLLHKHEINDDTDPGIFAEPPATEKRMGKKVNEKEVGSVRKLIRALTKGTEGLMVSQNKRGQYIITVGTYDLIPITTGSTPGTYTTTLQAGPNNTRVPQTTYRPGQPGYTTTDARYYNSTYFRLLIDPATFTIAKGSGQMPVSAQIKDYIETVSAKAKATNQFSIGNNQYYGYYNRDLKNYVIEQIYTK